MATTGLRPPSAIPAAAVTACCSAIPTSKQRSGNLSRKERRPVESGIAAVTATTFELDSPIFTRVSEKASV